MKTRTTRIFYKKLCVGIAAASLLTSGMSGAVYAEDDTQENSSALGRYLETEVELPENDGTLEIRDIVRLENGAVRLVGSSVESGMAMWDSADGGESWELAASLPEEYGGMYFTDLALCADGGGAGIAMVDLSYAENEAAQTGDGVAEAAGEENGEAEAAREEEDGNAGVAEPDSTEFVYYFVSFDGQGNVKKTEYDSYRGGALRFSREGKLLWLSPSGDAYVIDRETGEEMISLGGAADTIGVCGKEALLLMKSELLRYDLDTGEPAPRDETLEETLYSGGARYEQLSSAGYSILFAEDEEGRLYYCKSDGIFSHVMGGSVVEQIVDGTLNSLYDPTKALVSLEIAQQSFYVIYADEMGRTGLMKYEYDPDISSVPEKELTVYSLRENSGIRQIAVQFQKKYPDTFVHYQVGLGGTDGVTSADALRILNTEILAGSGPDILILDGVSVDTYTEKGVLADLSGMLAEIQEEEELLENIAYAYQAGDTVPAVPVRFGIPMAAGKSGILDQLSDLPSLLALCEEEPGLLSLPNTVSLPDILYSFCSAGWSNEDGTIDSEELAEYLHITKQIYNGLRENQPEDSEVPEWMDSYRESVKSLRQESGGDITSAAFYFLNLWMPDFQSRTSSLFLGTLLDIEDYSGISSLRREVENIEMKRWSGQQADAFVPMCTAGILKTAKEQQRAEDFVKYLLSEEGELANAGDGFPVNARAFASVLYDAKWGEGDGITVGGGFSEDEIYSLTYSWPTQEELEWLEDTAKQLTVCADTQSVQQEVVLEQLWRCLGGELGEDEAVNTIIQKINLYLAE